MPAIIAEYDKVLKAEGHVLGQARSPRLWETSVLGLTWPPQAAAILTRRSTATTCGSASRPPMHSENSVECRAAVPKLRNLAQSPIRTFKMRPKGRSRRLKQSSQPPPPPAPSLPAPETQSGTTAYSRVPL